MINGIADLELDVVTGGMDPNFKECVLGTTAGGPSGVYGKDADCSQGAILDLLNAFEKGVRKGMGGGKA